MKNSIKEPCGRDWRQMTGTERTRFCTHCEKHVYNLSARTESEAKKLLQEHSEICVRFRPRPDGSPFYRPVAAALVATAMLTTPVYASGLSTNTKTWLQKLFGANEEPFDAHLPQFSDLQPDPLVLPPGNLLMGAYYVTTNPRTVANETNRTLQVGCTDGGGMAVPPHSEKTMEVEPDATCVAVSSEGKIPLGRGNHRCKLHKRDLQCEEMPVAE